MTTALIGHTGFVGGNLARQAQFDDCFRSTNVEGMAGKDYDLVVSAGVSSLKWKANQDPEADREAIRRLVTVLERLGRVRTFVLISTIDVYDKAVAVDEDSALRSEALMPYGRNRWELEEFVKQRFDSVIIRLPNLFGSGLKKNPIYDLLHGNRIDQIHQDGVLQWYSLDNLWADIQRVLQHNLRLVNFATEPWPTRDLARTIFGVDLPGRLTPPAPTYDFWTKHAGLWGKTGPYLISRNELHTQLRQFVHRERMSGTVGA